MKATEWFYSQSFNSADRMPQSALQPPERPQMDSRDLRELDRRADELACESFNRCDDHCVDWLTSCCQVPDVIDVIAAAFRAEDEPTDVQRECRAKAIERLREKFVREEREWFRTIAISEGGI